MNKNAFVLFITIGVVLILALLNIFIVENSQLRQNLSVQQIQFTQAKYHFDFAKKLLKQLAVDLNVTKTVDFDGIIGYEVKAEIFKEGSNTKAFLKVQATNNEHIKITQIFSLD